jgi:pimeloyl-ACP methyl ester carboxylesterase
MKVLSITHRQKCVAIDLPMFGISGHIDIERYKTNQELCECYADVIGNTLQKLGIVEDTVLVAHSLGGFLSIYVADRFPIKKLVLLNPAGILPTLGEWGYYWGMFFKMGLPTTAFHLPLVSSDGLINIGKVMYGGGGGGSITNVDDITNFWLSFYSNPNNEGHRIVQRLITLRPFYSYWNTPAFTNLMDVYKNVPTSICFGVSDTVCPSHIGSFFASTHTR